MTKIFLVDDHKLLRHGMAELVSKLEGYSVIGQASDGIEFTEWVGDGAHPDIVILDIQMPLMDGEQTAHWLKANHPDIKILVLSMFDDDLSILRMIRAGACGYLLKDSDPKQLQEALNNIRDKGFHHSDLVSNALLNEVLAEKSNGVPELMPFTPRELEFINLVCTDLSYKEIAVTMDCSPRTVDSFRDYVFSKLGIKSRVALALYAVKSGLVKF